MENLTIPLITLLSPIIGWLIYLTIKSFQNDKSIAINTNNDATVSVQIRELKVDMDKKIDKFETHVNAKFDQVFKKIDEITKIK